MITDPSGTIPNTFNLIKEINTKGADGKRKVDLDKAQVMTEFMKKYGNMAWTQSLLADFCDDELR